MNPAHISLPPTKNYGPAPRGSWARGDLYLLFCRGNAQCSPPYSTTSPTFMEPGSAALHPQPPLFALGLGPTKTRQGGWMHMGEPRLALSRRVSASPSLPGPRTVRSPLSKTLQNLGLPAPQSSRVLLIASQNECQEK